MRCLPVLVLVACSVAEEGVDDTDAVEPTPCHLVVTDIDETLTTLDSEFIAQLADPTYDPAMRPDANTLLQGYADKGYRIVYITARGELMTLPDGRSAREATEDWLVAHDFPLLDAGDLYLSEGVGAFGSGAVAYKAEVLQARLDAGETLDWAYGNAISDIDAFQEVGIPDDHIFLVGVNAGQEGVEPIADADAFTAHLAVQMPAVTDAAACDGP